MIGDFYTFGISSVFTSFSRAPLTPHSLPTRRSSDLPSPAAWPKLSHGTPRAASSCVISADAPISAKTNRSEEHTSELQSPYELVCRLLLEKKKHRIALRRGDALHAPRAHHRQRLHRE